MPQRSQLPSFYPAMLHAYRVELGIGAVDSIYVLYLIRVHLCGLPDVHVDVAKHRASA